MTRQAVVGTKVALDVRAGVAHVTLGDGTKRNALSPHDWAELGGLARRLSDRDDVSVVEFRGANGTFSAGSNVRCWEHATAEDVDLDFEVMESALSAVEALPVPTIAAVEGVAAGAGCELAFACDLRLLAESARIGMPVVQLGVLVSPQFVKRLATVVGIARAREMLYTGRYMTAAQAELSGAATAVIPDDEFSSAVGQWSDRIASGPRRALMAAKAASIEAVRLKPGRATVRAWQFTDQEVFPERIAAFLRRSDQKVRSR
jgi:enoyl-CoA hydratase/carnithine racemase